MIAIIAPYPLKNTANGYMQRIKAIDSFFESEQRMYIELVGNFVGKRPHPERINDQVTVVKLNDRNVIHKLYLLLVIARCRFVYFHSAYNVLDFKLFFYFRKTIVDLHGVASDELKDLGNMKASKKLEMSEKFVFRKASLVIGVTNKMIDYYKSKYQSNVKTLILPIFDKTIFRRPISMINENSRPKIIYAGSAVKWQNIDDMLRTIKLTFKYYDYTILTGDVGVVEQSIKELNIPQGKVEIAHKTKEEVYEYYKKHDFGLVFRDDNIINRVSCPTKLIEYLRYGLIPVVDLEAIGDFKDLGYKYITKSDLINRTLPNKKQALEMVGANYKVLAKLDKQARNGATALLKFLEN